MALPTQRSTSSRRKIRRINLRLKKRHFMVCSRCKKTIPPHRACPFCGYYSGREVLKIKSKSKKLKNKSEKQPKEN